MPAINKRADKLAFRRSKSYWDWLSKIPHSIIENFTTLIVLSQRTDTTNNVLARSH